MMFSHILYHINSFSQYSMVEDINMLHITVHVEARKYLFEIFLKS